MYYKVISNPDLSDFQLQVAAAINDGSTLVGGVSVGVVDGVTVFVQAVTHD